VATPWLAHRGWASPEPMDPVRGGERGLYWSLGEIVEVAGLALGTGVLGLILAVLHARHESTNWLFWGVLSLMLVWASLRQGLRGGTIAASSAAAVALCVAAGLDAAEANLTPLRGNLLAQCSTALLIGVSASWIRASEQRYRQIVGHIPVVLYSGRFRRPGQPDSPAEVDITLVSAASQQVFGCAPDELCGGFADWLERVDADDRELVTAALAQLCLHHQPVTCEYRLVSASIVKNEHSTPGAGNPSLEKERWVRDTLAPHRNREGELDGWEGVIEDITAQRTLAHDLRRTTTMLHAIVSNLPTGVYVVHGTTGRPLLVNTRACQLLGQREALTAGIERLSTLYRLHHRDGSVYPWQELPVSRALRQGISCMSDDIVVHRPDGRRLPLVTWAAPVDLAGHGKADAAVWVLEDLSALRQAEATQRKSEERLRALSQVEMLGQLASGVVHDCNNLLTMIIGTADTLRLQSPNETSAHEPLKSISQAGVEAAQLLQQLLAFSKQRDVQTHRVDVNDIVRNTLQLLRGTLPGNIDVTSNPSAQPAYVLADETQLKQVLMNLCLNARDAMPLGGKLTIEIAVDENPPGPERPVPASRQLRDHVEASTRAPRLADQEPPARPRSEIRISVADTGQGMEERVRAQVFDLFFTTKEGGNGLGLAVAVQIIERFGGRIEVWSKPQQGSRFTIRLPGADGLSE